jgi:hypothetical protein
VPDIYLTLNARLRPLDRGDRFEDPLLDRLKKKIRKLSVTGGGTLMEANGEPSKCDIDLAFRGDADEALPLITATLDSLGAPIGSTARVSGKDKAVTFGTTEGVGVYLNGTELPDEVYQTNDVNELIARLSQSLGDAGEMYSYWEGSTETALYFYGPSADRLRQRMSEVLRTHPLAQRSRVESLTPPRSEA